jgi:hypothetical protein
MATLNYGLFVHNVYDGIEEPLNHHTQFIFFVMCEDINWAIHETHSYLHLTI